MGAAEPARRPVDPPAQPALDQGFDGDGLISLRSAVAAHADNLGLRAGRVSDLVLAAHELAANAVRHGGGNGRLRLWRVDDHLVCEISDSGGGLADPDSAGRTRPSPRSTGGRGLWLVRALCDTVDISTGPTGTTVTVTVHVS
jgi:anti-sigma regulatory factor (Ser/Thr protein kinase)